MAIDPRRPAATAEHLVTPVAELNTIVSIGAEPILIVGDIAATSRFDGAPSISRVWQKTSISA